MELPVEDARSVTGAEDRFRSSSFQFQFPYFLRKLARIKYHLWRYSRYMGSKFLFIFRAVTMSKYVEKH